MSDIKNYLRDSRTKEIDKQVNTLVDQLESAGWSVEFGRIGLRTTYALIYNEDHSTEIVGYTFIKDMKYYKENLGKLKSLQQAIARKDTDPSHKS